MVGTAEPYVSVELDAVTVSAGLFTVTLIEPVTVL